MRIIIIALAGPTCGGKTTLAKILRRILPNSLILHQDDFAPPAELIPFHPIHKLQDWDDAAGAIQWDRQRETIHYLRSTGTLPSVHDSHDHLNEQIPVPIADSKCEEWKEKFRSLEETQDPKTIYVIADGFLMLYDEESVREFDVRLFVRDRYDVLKGRREERNGYHTAALSTAEGSLWQDPPNYWDNIVYPAYVSAHKKMFIDGNVETGQVDTNAMEGVILLEGHTLGIEDMVSKACGAIYDRVKSGKEVKDWAKP